MKRKEEIYKDVTRFWKQILVKIILFFYGPQNQVEHFTGIPKSIIILAQEKLGDVILLSPLLYNLKKNYPDIIIHVAAFSPIYTYLEKDPNIDFVFRVKQDYFKYFKEVRKQKYDLLAKIIFPSHFYSIAC